jgi:histone H3/H4
MARSKQVAGGNSQKITKIERRPVMENGEPVIDEETGEQKFEDVTIVVHNPKQRARTLHKTVSKGGDVKERKPRRFRPGTVALREIRKYQKSTDSLFRRLPFERLCREIMVTYQPPSGALRIRADALEALQHAVEGYGVDLLRDSYRSTLARERETLCKRDIQLVRELREETLPMNVSRK